MGAGVVAGWLNGIPAVVIKPESGVAAQAAPASPGSGPRVTVTKATAGVTRRAKAGPSSLAASVAVRN